MAAPPFSSDLLEWWDNRTGDLAVSVGNISTWTGRVNGNILTAGSTPPALVTIGSVNYVSFANAWFTLSSGFALDAQNSSVFVFYRGVNNDSNFRSIWHMTSGSDVDTLYIDNNHKVAHWNGGGEISGYQIADNIATVFQSCSAANVIVGAGNTKTTVGANSSGTNSGGFLGLWSGSNFPLIGDVLGVIVYNRSLTASEVDQVLDFGTFQYNATSRTYDKFVVFDGDSITFGVDSTNPRYYSYPAQLAQSCIPQPKWANVGIGGSTIEGNSGALNTISALTGCGMGTITSVLMQGTNDIASFARTSAEIISDLTTWNTNVHTSFPSAKTVGLTILNRTVFDSGMSAIQAAVNAAILGGSCGFDYWFDAAAIPQLLDPSNPLYFAQNGPSDNGTHLTDLGYSILASNVKAFLVANGRLDPNPSPASTSIPITIGGHEWGVSII